MREVNGYFSQYDISLICNIFQHIEARFLKYDMQVWKTTYITRISFVIPLFDWKEYPISETLFSKLV